MDSSQVQQRRRFVPQHNEAELIYQACSDPQAFSVLYRRYVTQVYRYCLSRTHNIADAEDITSQVFTEVWEALPRYRHQYGFVSWLFTIVRRRVIDYYRQKRQLTVLDENREGEIGSDPITKVIEDEALQQLYALMNGLNARQQEYLRLRFAGGLKYQEIATILGKSEASVKMAIRRILRRLHAQWREEDE